MNLNLKIENFLLILGLIFLPAFLFFNPENFAQYDFYDVFLILLFHSFLVLSFSIVICPTYLIFKKKINFSNFTILSTCIFYLLFFYKKFLIYFKNFENFFYLLDNLILIIIYLSFFLLILFLLINYTNKFKKFLKIYLIINFLIILFDHSNFFLKNSNVKNLDRLSKNNNILDKMNRPISSDGDIFLIVLDGMMSLDLAEKYKIVEDKDHYNKKLEENNFQYNFSFKSNYNVTYLSLASLLIGNYPVDEDSPRYTSRKNFFPIMIKNDKLEKEFFDILKKSKRDFFWLGNSWGECTVNKFVNCLNYNQNVNFVNKIKHLYSNSIFIYPLNIYLSVKDVKKIDSINFLNNEKFYINTKKMSHRSIFLIHVMSPHPPYLFDENCNLFKVPINIKNLSLDLSKKYYQTSYRCLIDYVTIWSKKIRKINRNNLIYILGDHGWFFDDKLVNLKNKLNKTNTRFMSFYSQSVPDKCKNLPPPNSIINILRHALNCVDGQNIEYLSDKKFIAFYENEKDYGLVSEYID